MSEHKTDGDDHHERRRVAVYTRVAADDGSSLEAQERGIRELVAAERKEVVVASFQDCGSGLTLDRPGLEQLLDAANRHEFDVVLVWSVDRLSRSTRKLLALCDRLLAVGVGVRATSEPFDTLSHQGRAKLSLLRLLVAADQEMHIERARAGRILAAEDGRWPGGTAPFGYRINRQSKVLEVVRREGDVVRRIFKMYASGEVSLTEIARTLNRQGLRTRSGRAWTPHTVRDVVERDTYCGVIHVGGRQFPGRHRPLIDEDLWARAAVRTAQLATKGTGRG